MKMVRLISSILVAFFVIAAIGTIVADEKNIVWLSRNKNPGLFGIFVYSGMLFLCSALASHYSLARRNETD
jgi:hypothetical protein